MTITGQHTGSTKGAWQVERQHDTVDAVRIVARSNGRFIREIAEVNTPDGDPEGHANARVMAAGKVLLEAAIETMRLWRKHGLGDDECESEPVYARLRDAICAATGWTKDEFEQQMGG